MLALAGTANLGKQSDLEKEQLAGAEEELRWLTSLRAAQLEKKRILQGYLQRLCAGEQGPPQAHLRHKAVPEPPPPKIAKALDLWAAISGALLVTVLILLAAFQPRLWLLWTALAILVFGAIEAALRGKMARYLLTSTIVLAAITAVILVIDYWQWVLPGALLFVFFYSALVNLRELRSRHRMQAGSTAVRGGDPE